MTLSTCTAHIHSSMPVVCNSVVVISMSSPGWAGSPLSRPATCTCGAEDPAVLELGIARRGVHLLLATVLEKVAERGDRRVGIAVHDDMAVVEEDRPVADPAHRPASG